MRWLCLLALPTLVLRAQTPAPEPIRITLADAIARARIYGAQVSSATLAARLAHQDTVQTRAGLLPNISALNQFIYTEGNGTASGRFVANDGVHVYNEQAVFHQDLFNAFRRAELRRAQAAEAIALAKRDVAARGLNATVTADFYTLLSAARKVENAKVSAEDAAKFLDITQKEEHGGEAAKADVIKAQLQSEARQRDLADAVVTVEKARVALAVLIFPDVTRDYSAVDDLDTIPPLENVAPQEAGVAAQNPDVRVAQSSLLAAHHDVDVARYAYLPSLALDFFYGIDANQFAGNTDYPTPESGRSTLPDYLVTGRRNLGYSGEITLNVPIWNWGATRSKVKQAEIREQQARADLSVAQKQLRADLETAYLEAQTARDQIGSLRRAVDLSTESLRLAVLRYQAGEALVLEVVDAQTTLAAARNAYTDGLARYHVALADVEILTGRLE